MINNYLEEPAQLDFLNERAIILHFRALLDLHDLLLNGLDYEMEKFRKKLFEIGWSKDRIYELIHIASLKTRYEQFLPHPVRGTDRNRF